MREKNKKRKLYNRLSGVSLTVMLLALMTASINSIGCAHKIVIHPLAEDFKLVNAGDTVTVKKRGALVSDYWLSNVAGVEVEQ